MPTELPHFLRFARALALVSGVALTGCGATVTSQDVPPTPDGPGSDGVVAAPDRPMVDAGISPPPDTALGISAPPDVGSPPGIVASPDAGVSEPPDGGFVGVDAGPDVLFTGVVDAPIEDVATGIDVGPGDDVIRDGIAPAPDASVLDVPFGVEGGPQVAPELPWA